MYMYAGLSMKIITWCFSKGPLTTLGWEVKPSYRTNGPRRSDHSIYDKRTGGSHLLCTSILLHWS